MSAFAAQLRPQRIGAAALRLAALGLGALLFAAVLALQLRNNPPPLALALGGGIGALGVLALSLARYQSAVGLGVVLLFFVKVEPAPTDAVFLVAMAVAVVTGHFTVARVPRTIAALVGVFVIINVIALAEVADTARAIRFSFVTFYLALLALWLGGWIDSRHRARTVARAYVAAAVFSGALGTLAYIGGPGGNVFLEYGGTRAVGLYKDPNVYGAFLVPAALIVVDELLSPKLLAGRRATKIAMFILLTLGIVLSFSRAAWINLTLGITMMIVVFALRRGGVRRALQLLTSAAVAVALVATALAATGSLTFLQSRAQVQAYDTQRFGAQAEGLRLVAAHPFGVGPGQFELYSPLSAHSTYVRALAELGILGLVAVLGIFLATLVLGARNAALGRETFGVGSAPLLGAWSGLLLSGFVIDTLHWRHLWLVAALIWAGTIRRR